MVNNLTEKQRGIGLDQVLSFLVAFIAFTIPLSQYISSRVIVITLLLSLRRAHIRKVLASGWDMVLYFALLSFGLLITSDVALGIRTLETSLSVLALPLIFCGLREFNESAVRSIFISFCGGVSLASLILVVNAIWRFCVTGNSNVLFFYELTGLLDFQPTYFAYFLVFAITCGLYLLQFDHSINQPKLLVIMIISLFCVLMLTGGRTSFISILMIFSYFILINFPSLSISRSSTTFVLVIAMTIGLFAMSNLLYKGEAISDSWERFDLWAAGVHANDDVLLGVGTGSGRLALNEYYRKNGLMQFAEDNMNAHNEYLQTYLSHGIIGLTVLMILIGRPLFLGFKANYSMAILVIFPFVIYGVTEVFLDRYQGIVFFAFLHQLLVSRLLSSSKELPASIVN